MNFNAREKILIKLIRNSSNCNKEYLKKFIEFLYLLIAIVE